MAHIIINPSLSAAIGYKIFLNPPKFAVVIAILEPANSTRTDNRTRHELAYPGIMKLLHLKYPIDSITVLFFLFFFILYLQRNQGKLPWRCHIEGPNILRAVP